MSSLYPVLLDLGAARVLVVGGGKVAARKVRTLVESGCRPEIVSPALDDELAGQVREYALRHQARSYQAGDAAGCVLVIASTDRPEVNAAVAAEARAAGAWVNVVDDPGASTVQLPALVREGEVVAALSTGGASPLLARRVRDRLRGVITPGLGRAVERLRLARERVQARWPDDESRRRAFWFELIDEEFLDSATAGRDDEVESRIEECLSRP